MLRSMIASLLVTILPVVASAGEFYPGPGKTLVVVGGDSQSPSFAAFQELTGFPPSAQVDWEKDTSSDGAGIPFMSQMDHTALFIEWDFRKEGALKEVTQGKHDDKIREFGELIASTKRPVFLNIGVEVDLPKNPGFAEEYKAGHRYIKDFYDRMAVKNICYIMHMACHQNPSVQEIERFYPGDKYVDMLCCSLYGSGNVAGAERLAGFARRHKKGFGIAECGGNFVVKGAHRDWKRYWKPLFEFVKRNDVRLMVYLNCDDGTPTADHFKMMSPQVLQGWKDEMSKPRYLLGREGLYKSLKYGGATKAFSE